MCCFWTILIFLGPRVANIVWWIANPVRWVGDTNLSAFDSAIWPILGIVFVPWTTLMYLLVFPGGVTGFDWFWLALAVLCDVSMYAGGGVGNRSRLGR